MLIDIYYILLCMDRYELEFVMEFRRSIIDNCRYLAIMLTMMLYWKNSHRDKGHETYLHNKKWRRNKWSWTSSWLLHNYIGLWLTNFYLSLGMIFLILSNWVFIFLFWFNFYLFSIRIELLNAFSKWR